MNHEVLLPGHLITMYVKEKLEDMLINMKGYIVKDYRMNKVKCTADMISGKYFQRMAERFGTTIGTRIGTFLSTGNIQSSTGLDLMQVHTLRYSSVLY